MAMEAGGGTELEVPTASSSSVTRHPGYFVCVDR